MNYTDANRAVWDRKAVYYDETYRNPDVNGRITEKVIEALCKYFSPGMNLLEIGCGTGDDAVELAARGMKIAAADVSPEMINCAAGKARAAGLEDAVNFSVMAAEDVGALKPAVFDGAYSLLGPLNCVKGLSRFAGSMAELLKPGSFFITSVINRVCLWEIFYYCAKLKFNDAFRRLRRGPVEVKMFHDMPPVEVRYYSPGSFFSFFKRYFTLEKVLALPLISPPLHLKEVYTGLKPAFRFFEPAEERLSGIFPLNRFGDHFLMVIKRR